jgi:hypothetical protein
VCVCVCLLAQLLSPRGGDGEGPFGECVCVCVCLLAQLLSPRGGGDGGGPFGEDVGTGLWCRQGNPT